MKTIILDIETWTPDWNEGENGWEDESFAPTAFHEPVVVAWMVVERTSKKVDAEIETELSFDVKTRRIDKNDEREILLELREDFKISHRLVTWNGRGFDMPVLACRAMHYSVDWAFWHRWRHRFPSYNDLKHYDLLDQLGDYGAARGLRQDRVAKLCGLPGKPGIHGSEIHALWHGNKDGDRDRVEAYCLSDVTQLWMIYLRFASVFFGIPAEVTEEAERCTREVFGGVIE